LTIRTAPFEFLDNAAKLLYPESNRFEGAFMKIQNYKQVKGVNTNPGVTMHVVAGVDEKAPNFVMRLFEIEPGSATTLHTHAWEHEFFVVEGKGAVKSGGKEFPIQAGDAAMVLPNEEHSIMNNHKEMLRVICIVPLVEGKMPGMVAGKK
jgi:quercetin dioxygenase-like cupin family protein